MKISELLKNFSFVQIFGPKDPVFENISDDSRKIKEGWYFVARQGSQVDGHKYISKAIKNGATGIIGDNKELLAEAIEDDLAVIWVKDLCYGSLCQAFHGYPSKELQNLAVTGTNGKTTSSYMIEHILAFKGKKSVVFGTVDYRFPGAVFKAKTTSPDPMELAEIMAKAVQSGAEYSIIEASSHALDQNRLADIHFKACAFSNLSQDHLDYHKGMDDYFEAKFKLTKLCDHFASNVDDAYGKKIKSMRSDCFSFGLDQRAQLRLVPISSDLDGSKAKLYFKHQSLELSLPIPGKHNLENAMAAISICILSGFSIKDCCEALREMMQIPGRLEKVENALGVSAFVDYAHTPGAVSKVLGALRKVLPREKKIFSVLGCGGNRDKGKRPKMALAALENSDFCFFSSDNPRFEDPEAILDDMCSELKGNEGFIREADRSEAISLGLKKAKAESAVLVVLGKGHEDYQEIKDKRIFMDDRKTIIVRAQEISECK